MLYILNYRESKTRPNNYLSYNRRRVEVCYELINFLKSFTGMKRVKIELSDEELYDAHPKIIRWRPYIADIFEWKFTALYSSPILICDTELENMFSYVPDTLYFRIIKDTRKR